MRKVLGEALAIFAIAAISGSVAFVAHPKAPVYPASGLERELEAVLDMGPVLWVDARAEDDFNRGRLDGAVLLNEERWEELLVGFLDAWPADSPIVVYCSSESCLRSHSVADRLRDELGMSDVFVLKGGWERLVEAGLVSEDPK